MDPISYPTLEISGREVSLKFRQYDVIALSKAGIDLQNMKPLSLLSAAGIEQNLLLLKHAVAHEIEISVDELSKQFEFGDAARIDLALASAIKKAASQIAGTMAASAVETAKTTEAVQ